MEDVAAVSPGFPEPGSPGRVPLSTASFLTVSCGQSPQTWPQRVKWEILNLLLYTVGSRILSSREKETHSWSPCQVRRGHSAVLPPGIHTQSQCHSTEVSASTVPSPVRDQPQASRDTRPFLPSSGSCSRTLRETNIRPQPYSASQLWDRGDSPPVPQVSSRPLGVLLSLRCTPCLLPSQGCRTPAGTTFPGLDPPGLRTAAPSYPAALFPKRGRGAEQ